MKIGNTRIDNKSFFFGLGTALILCVVPKISEPVVNMVTSIRNKISGGK